MSGNWTNIVIGVVVGVIVGIATWGVGYGVYAVALGTLAFGVTTSLLQSKTAGKGIGGSGIKDAVAADFEISSAAEGIPIPVVFGWVRNPGNYLRYEKSTFRAVPVTQSTGGGGGGGGKGGGGGGGGSPSSVVVGYNYYMSMDVGLCMGSIDKVKAIYDGQTITAIGGEINFDDDDSVVVTIGNDQSSGSVRVFRGSQTQTRIEGEPYFSADSNYRGVAYASFQDFFIGPQPQPKTYLFELHRYPEVLDAEGVTIPGFKVKGSDNPANPAYEDANPSAIVFEIMTNTTWGAGIPVELFDIESFKNAATYYASKNIGLSLSLESQSDLTSFIDTIRQHVNLIITWDGIQISARVLMDTVANSTIADVFNSDVVSNVEFSRPAWPSMTNELKLRFTNREAGYKIELVQNQDTAAINVSGKINSRELQMNAFPSRAIAEAQAARMLSEAAFPQASLSFNLARCTRAKAGDLVQFEWNEWSEGKTVSYWRIRTINDRNQSPDGMRVECVEDFYSTPYEGEPVPHVALIPSFENGSFRDGSDLNLATGEGTPGSIAPVVLSEANIWLTQGKASILIGAEYGGYGQIATTNYWQLDSGGDKHFMGQTHNSSITGTLVTAIDAVPRGVCRGAATKFQISLTRDIVNAGPLLAAASMVRLPTDDFEVLLPARSNLMLIGNEVFQIGNIEESGTAGVYDVLVYLRAQYGTDAAAHAIGKKFLFLKEFSEGFILEIPSLGFPESVPVNIIERVITPRAEMPAEIETPGPYAGGFVRLGARPFTPSFLSKSFVGGFGYSWTVKVRPRWHADGAHSTEDMDADLGKVMLAMPADYAFLSKTYLAGVEVGTGIFFHFPTTVTYTPDTGNDATGGTVTLSNLIAGSFDEVRIWASYKGKLSNAPLIVLA